MSRVGRRGAGGAAPDRPRSGDARWILSAKLLLLCLALLACALGLRLAQSVERQLPEAQLAAIDGRLTGAFSMALRTATPAARDGWQFREASRIFTATAIGRRSPARLEDDLLRQVRDASSGFGQVQQAAARLWVLEAGGSQPDAGHAEVAMLLDSALERGMPHEMQAVTRLWAGVYEHLGLGAASSRAQATFDLGHPHGPMLQYFAPRVRAMAAALDAAGRSEEANAMRGGLLRVLRELVLEPGPVGIRLLAADLLADALVSLADSESGQPDARSSSARSLAADLRDWRQAVRGELAARSSSVLVLGNGPAYVKEAHDGAVFRVLLTRFLRPAAIVSGVAAVAFAVFWLRRTARPALRDVLVPTGLAAAIGVVGWLSGGVWAGGVAGAPHDVFRTPDDAGLFAHAYPWVVAAGVLAALTAVAMPWRRGWSARLGAVGTLVCFAAGLLLAIAAQSALRSLDGYEQIDADDPLAALGFEDAGALRDLREVELP